MLVKSVSASAFVLSLVLTLATAATAQAPTRPNSQSTANEHHQAMSAMMKDMAQQMSAMADQMGHGDVGPDQEKQMGRRMDRMSGMMHRMSGMAMHPDMRDSEFRSQMGRMRGQMNDMMHNSSPNSPPSRSGTGGGAADPHGHE